MLSQGVFADALAITSYVGQGRQEPQVEVMPEGLQCAFADIPYVIGCVVQESQSLQPRVANEILEQYYIVNDYTGEYLGQSTHSYDNENQCWVFTTYWPYQPDKSAKFQWSLTRSVGVASDYKIINVATGHALQDSNDSFNDEGDHVVTTTSERATVSCKWLIQDDSNGSYSIRNASSGFTLGASKKKFNGRGDHHILSSPHANDYPSFKKWQWRFVRCVAVKV